MPTTPNYGLRYPANTDSADIQGHIANLATDLDNQLLYFNNSQQGIYTIKRDFDATTPLVTVNATTTETTLVTVPISGAQVGDSYKLTIFGTYQNNSAANATFTTRAKLGGTTYLTGATANIATNATRRALLMTVMVVIESLTVQHIFGSTVLGAASTALSQPIGIGGLGRQWSNQNLATSKDLVVTQAHSNTNANITTAIHGYTFERVW